MSNVDSVPFHEGMTRHNGDKTTTRHHVFELPGGDERMVAIKIGDEQAANAEAEREQFLLSVYPPSLTEGLERDLEKMTKLFQELAGYDRNGNPQLRVTGRDREVLEMKIANRRNALVQAQRDRALAERVQAQARAAKQAQEVRISAAADAKAQRMIEDAEIDRRAKQAAARAGVRS